MKVLVTGSAGFLGRHFRLALLPYMAYGIDIADGHDALDFFRDVDEHVDLVLHLAAVSPHRAAIDGRALTVGAGSLALDAAMFEWATRTRPGRIVYFSSSAAYPVSLQMVRREWLRANPAFGRTVDLARSVGMREDSIRLDEPHIGAPDAIYGWVKLTGERLADAYRTQGGAVTVVRPFSGYGEDQSADFPFGAFRDRALRREDPFTIWGNGEQVRDWIHVDDIVGATLAAVEQDVDGPLNLCTGTGTSMRELAELFTAAAGYRPEFELYPDKPAGVAYRVGDPARLHEIYAPKVSIEEGVKRALEAAS